MTMPVSALRKTPTVLTIVLNYRTAEMTLQSLEAARIAMQGIPGGIVVVDNDSQDGSYERIFAKVAAEGWDAGGAVRVVQSGHNGGFGAGNNVGMRMGLPDGSAPDYIYILNSDAFPEPEAITRLLAYLEATPKAGFAGSLIHGDEGEPQQSAFRFPSIISEFESALRFGFVSSLLKNFRVPMEIPTRSGPVDWVAGASLLMRRSALEEIGSFDETFFLYFEEVDLCLRAARAGYTTDYVPESRVTHIGSVSTGMKDWERVPAYWYQSRWHYFAKNHGRAYAAAATLAHLVGGWLNALRCLVIGRKRRVARGFLTTMLAHDFRALLQRSGPAARHKSQGAA